MLETKEDACAASGASPTCCFHLCEGCFHFKGNLDDYNYSDVSLSQVFSESKRSEFVLVKRKFDGVFFFISDNKPSENP